MEGPGRQDKPLLLQGPYRAGKTLLVLGEVIDFKLRQPLSEVIIVVPSARYRKALRERLFKLLCRKESAPGIFNLKIVPFYELCAQVLTACLTGFKRLPDDLQVSLVRETLLSRKSSGDLKILSSVAEFHGTARAVAQLIDEFERAGLGPAEVSLALGKSAAAESRYFDLAQVYHGYWDSCSVSGFLDQKRIALKARELLHSGAMPAGFRFDLAAIDGFDRVSHLQAQIFAGLALHATRTVLTFDYVDPDGEQAGGATASARLYAWKASSMEEIRTVLNPGIQVVFPPQRPKPRVVVSTHLDRFMEMKEIARGCKEALLSREVPLEEILVVCRSIDSYAGAVESAFEQAGVPYFIEGSVAVSSLPAFHFIRLLLTAAKDEFPRRKVIDFLRSPYLKPDSSGLSPQSVSRLDRRSHEMAVIGTIDGWRGFLTRENDSNLSVLEELLQTLTPPPTATTGEFLVWLEDSLDRYFRLPASEYDIRSTAASEEREVLRAVRTALKTLLLEDSLLKTTSSSYEQFLSRLLTLLESANCSRPAPAAPAVVVCSADLAPNRPFREVFVAGLTEGEFPRRHRDSGFLSQDEIARWLSMGIDLRDPRHEPGFERALFYSLLERASSAIYLSLPQFEMTGEELIPSFYLKELPESGYEVWHSELRTLQGSLATPVSAPDFFAGCMWYSGYRRAETLALETGLYKEWERRLADRIAACATRLSSRDNVYNGYLCDFFEAGALTSPLPDSWTASKLNDYGQCPFRFWTSHILDLAPRQEPEAGLTASLRGQFYHKALEIYFTRYAALPLNDRKEKREDLIEPSFAEALRWLESRTEFQPSRFWENEKQELMFRFRRFVLREFDRLVKQGALRAPSMFEVRFGYTTDASYPPLVLESSSGQIRIRGIIDRIDLPYGCTPETLGQMRGEHGEIPGITLIDYKTGSRPIKDTDALDGRAIQIPLYALAAEQSIVPGSRVTDGCYLSISQAKSIGAIDFDKLPELKEKTREFVRTFVRSIEKGNFSLKPNGRKVCETCDHHSVCRISEVGYAHTGEGSHG